MICRKRRPHGHFHQAGVVHRAHQGKDLGALAVFRALAGVPLGPHVDDFRHVGPGLDVVDDGREAKKAGLGGVGRPGVGLADEALDGGHQRRLLAAHKGPGPLADLEVEVELGAQDVVPQETEFPGLVDGEFQALHRQGVFVAHVDVALAGADGIGPDDHALDDGVGVALHDRPVHEGPGVALVAVADDELYHALGFPAQAPLAAGGETAAAPAPEPRALHLVDDLVGGHGEQRLAERPVAPHGQVVVQALGVDEIELPQHDGGLALVEGHLALVGAGVVAHRVVVDQAVHHGAPRQGLLDDFRAHPGG